MFSFFLFLFFAVLPATAEQCEWKIICEKLIPALRLGLLSLMMMIVHN